MNNQEALICNLLEKLEQKYLTDEQIRRAIIGNDVAKQDEIELIDALCQTVITSLNFGNYRRAVKYLALAINFCHQ